MPHSYQHLHAALIAGFATLAAPAFAQSVAFGPSLEGQGWKALTFRGLKPVDYRAEAPGRLALKAEGAASMVWKELPEAFWPRRSAKWRWKVDQSVPATNLAVKGGDDRAVAVYFLFAKDEASATRAKGASSLQSAVWWSGGAALVYVFGGTGTKNAVVASPHMGASGKLILRQPGSVAAGQWIGESADLASDFRRAFGREPGPLVGIAISSDSDDTKAVNIAAIESLTLE